ncbi:MAG TPA: ribonuclease HII [Candidatus Saccharimonadales bacterium]|jgi:ribonuclease HII|nr:ribonuclease HII [Candidatus Saccharimonadales bacterium]
MDEVGIDEVGRGALAGPLVVGAVILGTPIDGLRDSKTLSRPQRTNLARIITQEAAACGLGWVSSKEVDRLGLTKAIRLAILRALKQIEAIPGNSIKSIIIDGNYNFLADDPRSNTVIKADSSVACVSAASIIAKVARDEWMINTAAKLYPLYRFENHVGYGTQSHIEYLRRFGPCAIHRVSFKPLSSSNCQVKGGLRPGINNTGEQVSG